MLGRETVAGELWHAEGSKIRCLACGHRCLVAPGRSGICKVRFNQEGELRVPFGYVAGVQSDPVEKKPFFHVMPGSDALTFGMLGCDFHCGYCQNWVTSQALRDPASHTPIQPATPQQLVAAAQYHGSRLVVSSYNEPLITAEWAVAVFKEARKADLLCAFVSNGNATPEALDYLQPWIAAYKIDLKGFNDQRYRSLGGTLAHVCRGIEMVLERGIWLEVVTLVVPGFNDSEAELRAIARFLVQCSRDVPWHVTAFHPDYKMSDGVRTRAAQLVRAAEIGMEEGLRYVYVGNIPGGVGRWENTFCPACSRAVIERAGYHVHSYRLTSAGDCPDCGGHLPGVWPATSVVEEFEPNCPPGRIGRRPRRVSLNGGR
jgi:pyruvate formate lyase activating enzyme